MTASGGPAPPLIVLVPGIDGTALLFYRQAPLLARDFEVTTFPLPADPGLSMADQAAQLRDLVADRSDGRGAILVGESYGGALSLVTALAHPEAVRGLVIVNSFPWLAGRTRLWLGPWLLRAVPWRAMPVLRRLTRSALHSAHTRPEDLAEFQRSSLAIDRCAYIRRLELLRHYDVRERLGELATPTLFLAADRDRLVPSLHWARYMAARAPLAHLTVLAGHGHACLINHDVDLSTHIVPWWATVSAAQAPASAPTGAST